MATRTSVGSGLWSVAGTWDTGVPLDNDIVVIATGHVVEFDVDQSGFANGIDGITVAGTLSLTRTAGVYYMKIKAAAAIGGTGTFDCGASALDPIPFVANHTITGGNGWNIQGGTGVGLTMTVYADEPVIKYVTVVGTEAIGQTILSVATDVTGEASYWKAGDIVRINDTKRYESEERTIAAGGIASNAITITAGLTGDKAEGSTIVLLTRNVKFVGVGGDLLKLFKVGKLTIAGGSFTAPARTVVSGYSTISGGVFYTSSYGITGTPIISGGVFCDFTCAVNASYLTISGGLFTGNNHVLYLGRDVFVSGGIFTCNNNCFYQSSIINIVGGSFSNNNKLCETCANVKVYNVELVTMANSFNATDFTLYNTKIGSAAVLYYTNFNKFVYSQSTDYEQVAGAYKAWTRGGITSSQVVTVPTGYIKAMQTVLENAIVEGYWQKEIVIGAGASVNITSWLRKSASMTYLPRAIIFNKATIDPFAGGAGLHTFTMNNSVDTWESDIYTYTNSTTEDITLVIRCQGMNATGNMYSALDVEVINVDLTSALALLNAIKPKTDLIPASIAPANEYDARMTAIQSDLDNPAQYKADVSALATQASVNAIPTTPLLAANYTAPDNTKIGQIKTILDTPANFKADVTGIPAAVWAYTTRTLTSFGSLIADIWAHATRTLSAFGFTVNTNSDANVTAIKADYARRTGDYATAGAKMDIVNVPNATAVTAVQNGLSKPATPQTIIAPADMALNSTVAKDATVSKPGIAQTITAPATMALEATLTAIKGAGWTNETLKSVQDAVEAIDLSDIPKNTTTYDGKTWDELVKLVSAVLLGKLSGGGTGTLAFRDIADIKDRVVTTVNTDTGDRLTQTLDGA